MVTPGLGPGLSEVGVVGVEGMTGVAITLDDDRAAVDISVRVSGHGHWIASGTYKTLLDFRPTMHRKMLRYVHVYATQVMRTAAVNARARNEVRLARWLLMAADRIGPCEMPLTHELLASALAFRRPGVTDAIHRLEGEHLIRAQRGLITIRDRDGLEAFVGGGYGLAEREHRRLFGEQPDLVAADTGDAMKRTARD